MYQLKRINSFLLLLTMMFLAGIQQAKAEDDIPRLMIPATDATSSTFSFSSYVTPDRPYFTVYLWYRNTEHQDSYWEDAPTLYLDDDRYALKLEDIKGSKDLGNINKFLTCKVDGKDVFYVRYRGSFQSTDNFMTLFKNFRKTNDTWKDDYYVTIDIMPAENNVNAPHKVWVKGKAHLDKGDYEKIGETWAVSPEGYNIVTTEKPLSPFGLNAAYGSVEWTNPGKLTYTTPLYTANKNRPEGRYQPIIDGVYGEMGTSGKLQVTKSYDQDVRYADSISTPIGQRYYDQFDLYDTDRTKSPRQFTLNFFSGTGSWIGCDDDAGIRFTQISCDYNGYLVQGQSYNLSDGISMTLSSNVWARYGYLRCNDKTTFTFNCNSHRFTRVKLLKSDGSTCGSWSGGENASNQCEVTVNGGSDVYKIEFTFNEFVDGHQVTFIDDGRKNSAPLPVISNLKVDSKDAWNKKINLAWVFDSEYKGVTGVSTDNILIYRDSIVVDTLKGSATSWSDTKAVYDHAYTYYVSYHPRSWTDQTLTSGTYASVPAKLTHDFQISNFTVTPGTTGYNLEWNGTPIKSGFSGTYIISRCTVDSAGTASPMQEIATVQASASDKYKYLDQYVQAGINYQYQVSIYVQETTIATQPTMPSGTLSGIGITNLRATRGTYSDRVELKWSATTVTKQDYVDYRIYRHAIDGTGLQQYQQPNAWVLVDSIMGNQDVTPGYTDKKINCGVYYMYKVVGTPNSSGQSFELVCDGFARSTAVLDGTITYGSGAGSVAVAGVRVDLEPEKNANIKFNSLYFGTDSIGGLLWRKDAAALANYFEQGAYSMQMYLRPERGMTDPCLLDMRGTLKLTLCDEDAQEGYRIAAQVGNNVYKSAVRVAPCEFTHITFAYDGRGTSVLYLVKPQTLGSVVTDTLMNGVPIRWQPEPGYTEKISVCADADTRHTLKGYVDEVRFFTRQLTPDDVLNNYDRTMSGNEDNLIVYWSMDETADSLFHAYDYSQTDRIANENHAFVVHGCRASDVTPSRDQLSMHAMTDANGYYYIQGIPFVGNGTQYRIIPSKGVHSFDKPEENITVSSRYLTFTRNFTDNSSFSVKGVVYYENTTYPVEDCYFYVDNVLQKDRSGKTITSNSEGEFRLSVGIGRHVIRVAHRDHVFKYDGCYPAEGDREYNDSVSHLTFTDVTKAVVAGRVVGGAVERNKPLGFGQSVANIGAATLTLLTSTDVAHARSMNMLLDADEGIFNQNPDTLFYEAANPDYVRSTAYVGGSRDGGNAVKTITIHTDPATGEFAVKLPPVPYYVRTTVDHNENASTYLSTQQLFNASNMARLDSSIVYVDSIPHTFCYNASFMPTYYTVPQIAVVQPDNYVGAFGEARVPAGELTDSMDVYQVDPKTGQLVYNFGHPIFMGWKHYQFDISSFERYYNYDADPNNPVVYDYPSSEGLLTFKNPMDLTADTLENVPLDDEGRYSYQFSALEPNLVAPYLQPINISMALGDNNYEWEWNYNGEKTLQGAVFSAKQTGNNSVTKAPDTVDMILRDPFGTDSYTTWTTGSTYTNGFKRSSTWKYTAKKEKAKEDGVTVQQAVGAPGAYLVNAQSGSANRTKLSDYALSFENAMNFAWTVTTRDEISTSSSPHYDGPNGDVFVGHSGTVTFGEGQEVKLVDQQNGQHAIGVVDVMVMGEQIQSDFAYAQYDIVNSVIPNIRKLRDQRLLQISLDSLLSKRASYHNMGDSIVYMTHLKPGDPGFGTDNDDAIWGDDGYLTWRPDSLCAWGPSYTVFIPEGLTKQDYEWDAIVEANSDIANWEFILAENERMKLQAIRNPDDWRVASYSIAGSDRSFDHESNSEREYDFNFGFGFHKTRRFEFNIGNQNIQNRIKNVGLELEWGDERQPGYFHSGGSSEAFHYVLADHVDDNKHDISVYRAPDNNSYIFYQTSGVTSCPYEGEQVAQYYEPENRHVISKATTQLEVPHIYCPDPVKKGVPAGQWATFLLKLTNATTVDPQQTIDFNLSVVDDKYAAMSTVRFNGSDTYGHNYPVSLTGKQDSVVLRLEVKPVQGYINIDSLHICFSSSGQSSISDDMYLTANFQPTAEDVELAVDKTVVNTTVGPQLHLTASGYNAASTILNAVRLQQCEAGKDVWTTLRSYVNDPKDDTESQLRNTVDTLIDMSNSTLFPDGTYRYRAVTDCTVAGEAVEGYSDVVEVIKDLTLPKPKRLPSPSDGVLSPGDDILVEFNEEIEGSALNKADNFVIQAVLNDNKVAHEVALRLDGQEKAVAQSQTELTLGGTPFTICSWVKHEGTAGTLLRHGDFRLNIEDDGRLTAYINDDNKQQQHYTSANAIPKGEWSYVAAVYDHETGTLSAYYATGEKESTLFNHEYVGKEAQSQGIIYLGEGLKGAMHELSMFSAALPWDVIKEQMYLGKTHSTPSIIGYWRLDEGHGTKSEDRARSRHMLLNSATSWYMENENISMNTNEATAVAIPVAQLSANALQSYLIEMWALADADNAADSIRLMSIDEGGKLDVTLLKNGQLNLMVNGKQQTSSYSKLKFNDGQWHHVALNVLQGTTGQTNLIVDGTSIVTIASDNTPALSGSNMWLARGMKGMIDEVRLWHGSHTQDDIVENMYYRMDPAKESQLVGYYPMEVSKYDGFAQRVDSFTTRNMAYNAYLGSDLYIDESSATPTSSELAPGLKSAPKKTNLDFSFTASASEVSITLDHSAASLEDCHVSTTLRSYYDKHGNIGSPITWGFVVKQNPLMWNQTELSPAIPSGEMGQFKATLSNIGGEDENWTFGELPTWLQASPASGILPAYGSQEVVFTVLQGNPIGKYFATISASGNKGLDTPLDIVLKIEGEKPDWAAKVKSESMSLVAQLKIDEVISTDPDDMVGIFYHDECVGTGHPIYESSKDAYYVQTLIYGEMGQAEDTLEFQLYDASQGTIYPVAKATPALVFAPEKTAGDMDSPVIIENEDKMLQTIKLAADWSFVSLYLKPDDTSMSLLDPIASKVDYILDSNGNKAEYVNGAWTVDWSPLLPGKMFKVKMKEAATLSVVGTPVDPADYPQTINYGANWIGVTTPYSMSLAEAFAGLDPKEGDMVKDEIGFSTFTNGAWTSVVPGIEPGHGYVYTSKSNEAKTLIYPVNATKTASYKRTGISANRKYAHNMVALCTVQDEGRTISDDMDIQVYDQYGELRGHTIETLRDTLHLVFISGETEGEPLIIMAKHDGQTHVQILPQGFVRDGILGGLLNPYVIKAEGLTDISETVFDANSRLVVYSLSGQVVFKGQASDFNRHRLPLDDVCIVCECKPDGTMKTSKMRLNIKH